MLPLLKAIALAIYALAIATLTGLTGLAGLLPGRASVALLSVAALFLVIHALEVVFFWRHVRLYPGPLAFSVLLTMLFGVLHWKPLLDAQNPAQRKNS